MLKRRTFLGTVASTMMVAMAPRIVSASPDDTLAPDLKWRCEAIQTVGQPPRNRAPVVTGVSLDSTGNQLSVVGDDHFVSIYDFAERRFTNFLAEHRDWVRTARFQPNANRLFTAGNDRRLLAWDSMTWTRPEEIARHPAAIINVAFSPDGKRLATVGFEQTLRVYDALTGRLERALECVSDDNHAVAFSPDGSLLSAAGRCGTIRVWNASSGETVHEYKAHRQRVRGLVFNSANRLVSCSDDQSLKIADLLKPGETLTIGRSHAKQFDVLMLDEDSIVTAMSDNRIAVWSLSQARMTGTLNGHTGTVTSMTADGSRLISGSYDTQVRVWQRQLHASSPIDRQTSIDQGWSQRIK